MSIRTAYNYVQSWYSDMDHFGYNNAAVAGRNAGAGIYSSARFAMARLDEWPPVGVPFDERYELRYVRDRLDDEVGRGQFSGPVLSRILDEIDAVMNGDDIPTPKRPEIATPKRKRSRKQARPQRL